MKNLYIFSLLMIPFRNNVFYLYVFIVKRGVQMETLAEDKGKPINIRDFFDENGKVKYTLLAQQDDTHVYELVGKKVILDMLFPKRGRDFNIKISQYPSLKEGETLITKTLSVCPECKSLLRAIVFERDGKIWIRKVCPEHGEFEEVYWGDAEFYKLKSKEAADGRGIENPYVDIVNPCPFNCGLCGRHRSHTALLNLVVTNRCHLGCWYCLPSEEEAVFKIGDEVGLYTFQEMASMFNFENKVRIDGFSGEYSIPNNLYALTYDEGYIRWGKVTKFLRRYHKGKILNVITKTGRELKVTPEHKIFLFTDRSLYKKKAEDLKIGDKIVLAWNNSSAIDLVEDLDEIDILEGLKNLPYDEKERMYLHEIKGLNSSSEDGCGESISYWKSVDTMPLSTYYDLNMNTNVELCRDSTTFRLSSKLKISEELAKLIGYFISDGYYTYEDIRIKVGKREVENDIIGILEKLGCSYNIIRTKNKAKQIVIENRLIRLLFKYVFSIPEKAYNKRLPKQFLRYKRPLKLALLSGIFNGNGYVVKGKQHLYIGFDSISKDLIRDILYLLSSLGVFARVYKVDKRKMKDANYEHYKIHITGKDMVKLVNILYLALPHLSKLNRLDDREETRIFRFGDFFVDEVKNIIYEDYNNYVYDLEIESDEHSFLAGDGLLISNCFFYAQAAGYVYEPSLTHIKFMLESARRQKPIPAKAVQLTGGEPTMRDDLLEIIRMARELGYEHIQLNTTGIRFAYEPEYAKKVREAGVNTIYMSFDGVTPYTNPKNHWEIPYILESFRQARLGAVLVPTVIGNINLNEVGDMVKFGLRFNDVIRGVNFQPISLVGRVPIKERKKLRVTIPDVIKNIEEQTNGQIRMIDWYTVPITIPISRFVEAITGKPQFTISNHFACGAATYVVQDKHTGRIIAIPQFIDVYELASYLNELIDYINKGGIRKLALLKLVMKLNKFIDWKMVPEQLRKRKRLLWIMYKMFAKHDYEALGEFHFNSLFLGMMHFMDRYNYDVARVERCDIHYVMPDGRLVPFCTFNVFPEIYRDKAQKIYGMSISEYLKMNNMRSLAEERYKRNIKKLESGEIYRKYYEGFWNPDSISYKEKKLLSMKFGIPVIED